MDKPTQKKPAPKKQVQDKKKQVINVDANEEVPQVPIDAKPARPKKVDPVDFVFGKYVENGWETVKGLKGTMNDIIARRNGRFHFIQVITKETGEDPKFQGEFKNNFVQNAFSNGATPVYAHIVNGKVTFQDVNTNNRIIIGGTRKKDE